MCLTIIRPWLRSAVVAVLGLISVAATLAQPVLEIREQPAGRLDIRWSNQPPGFVLESTGSLTPPADWAPFPQPPVVSGDLSTVTVDPSVEVRFYRLRASALTGVLTTSPLPGESGVSVTRETIVRLSNPLSATALLSTDELYAEFGGRKLLSRVELSPGRTTATLFYLENLPASARIHVTFDAHSLEDFSGRVVDADGDGIPGGRATWDFSTVGTLPAANTAVRGHVFASERNPDGSNRPLQGVTVTVDGAEETLRATSDAQGYFELNPCPAGRFFVHVDGRTAAGSAWPSGAYYPFVGKAWETSSGTTNALPGGTGEIFLPLIPAGTLRAVSVASPTPITFTPEVIAANPALAGVQLVVPPNALFADSGARGGMVGIAPVPPDRLPEPLPPGLEMPLVITIQTDGPQNFAEPVPVRFPNLPDPKTGLKLPPGAKSGLWSFNHDTGRWEPQGAMTVSADGNFLDTDPGVGVRQPGWHGGNPGNNGKGPDDDGDDDDEEEDPECPDKNRNYLCDDHEPKECRDKELSAYFNASDCFSDITLNLAASDLGWAESCAMGAAIGSWRVARDCLVFDLGACESSASAKAIDAGIGCIPKIGGWIGSFKCAVETIQAYEDYYACLKGKSARRAGSFALATSAPQFPQVPEYLVRARRDLENQIRLAELAQVYLAEVLGTDRWNQIGFDEDPSAFDALVQALQQALAPAGDGGTLLTAEEEAALLALPRPGFATQADVVALVNRLRQLQSSPPDPALRARMLAALEPLLAAAEPLPADGWEGLMDGGIRGLLTLAEAFEPQVGSEEFPARAHFYLLKDLETGFTRRGRLNPAGNFDPVVLPPNRLHAVMYFDPVESRLGTTLFRSGSAGGSTRILAARLVVDTRPDADADGLSDLAEALLGTASDRGDTDGDGRSDRIELADGTSPLDGIALPTGIVGAADVPESEILTVAAEGNVAYAGGPNNALTLFDLTQPRQPVRLGTLALAGQDYSQTLAANAGLVAAGGPSGLALVDARNPANPTLIADVPLGNVVALAWLGTDVVTLSASKLSLIEGSTGVEQLIVTLPEAGHDVQTLGDFVYVLTSARLIVFRRVDNLLFETDRIDVSGAKAPLETGRKLFVGGGRAYVGTFTGFSVVDIRNPFDLSLLGTPPSTQAAIHDLAANDAGLLLPVVSFSGTATLAVGAYNVTDPADVTRFLTSWPTPGDARALTLHRGLAYVADTRGDLQVLNYLSPDTAGVAPTVAFTANFALAPARAAFGARLRLLVDARDDVQVRDVTAFVDDEPAASDGSFPFQLEFTAPGAGEGRSNFTLRLRATDTAGNTRWTDPLVVALAAAINPPRLLETFPPPSSRVDNIVLTNVFLRFDQPLAVDSITAGMLKVVGAGPDKQFGTADDVDRFGVLRQGTDPARLEWVGTNQFPVGQFRVTLAAGLRGTNDAPRPEPVSWTFESVSIRPRLAGSTPSGTSATPVDGLARVVARLDLAAQSQRASTAVFTLREAGPDRTRGNADDFSVPLGSVEFETTGRSFLLKPVKPLGAGRYRVLLTGTGFTTSQADFELRPVPNEWINPAGGLWSSAANWAGGAPLANDFLRVPRLVPGLTTTNRSLVPLARIECEADLVQEPGTLTLKGEGLLDGLSRFIGSDIGSAVLGGGGTLINRGTMQLSGGTFAHALELQDITVANRGLLEWKSGRLSFSDPAALIFNEPTGVFDVGAAATHTFNGTSSTGQRGRILNAGLLRKIADTNVTHFRTVTVENSGRILVSAGQLELGDITGPGEIEIQPGGQISIIGRLQLPPDARISGGGDLSIVGGSTNAPQVLAYRHELTGVATAESKYIDVRRALNHPGIQFQSRNGWFRFFAPLTARRLWNFKGSFGGIELNAPTTTEILQLNQGILAGPATIAVTEDFLWSGGKIQPGGEITIQRGGEISLGTLDQRQVRILPGAVVTGLGGAISASARDLEGRVVNEGTFVKRGADRLVIRVKLENRGLMRFEEGQLLVERRAPGSDGQLFLSGGELQFAGGDLELYLQSNLSPTNGVISGFGRIVHIGGGFGSKLENRALVRLNAPGKSLEIVGMEYRQTAAGELEVTLGAAGCGRLIGDPDWILSLAGRLRVVLEPGFVPEVGQSFIICQGFRNGTLSEVILPNLGADRKLVLTYPADQVVLTVVAGP
jgi:hypothetical protein